MTREERFAFVNRVIREQLREQDFPAGSTEAWLAHCYGPSQVEEPAVLSDDEIIEAEAERHPERLAAYIREYATVEDALKHLTADQFDRWMQRTEGSRQKEAAEKAAKRAAQLAPLARGRAIAAANRAARKRAKETPE